MGDVLAFYLTLSGQELAMRSDSELQNRSAGGMGGLSSGTQMPAPELLKELEAYSPIVVLLLQKMHSLTSAQFARHISAFHMLLVELTTVTSLEVRQMLQQVLARYFSSEQHL